MSVGISQPGALVFCRRLLRRQLVLSLRRPVAVGNPLLFFAMVVALFPLGIGPAPDTLATFRPRHSLDCRAAGQPAVRRRDLSERF